MFVSNILGQDVFKGLWIWPLWLLSIRNSLSREHVQADSLATAFPLKAQSKTEFHTRNCYMLCEISQLKQEIINLYEVWRNQKPIINAIVCLHDDPVGV
jgi:hypothetical protein